MTSRIDYCNALLASVPRTMKSCRQCRGHTQKFDRDLMHILHDELHWSDVAQRVTFKLCTTVYKCFHSLCLSELCVPIADVAGRHQLGSANRGLQYFPRYNMSTYGRRALSYAGPHAWNQLPENLRKSTSITILKRSLKTFLFQQITQSAH